MQLDVTVKIETAKVGYGYTGTCSIKGVDVDLRGQTSFRFYNHLGKLRWLVSNKAGRVFLGNSPSPSRRVLALEQKVAIAMIGYPLWNAAGVHSLLQCFSKSDRELLRERQGIEMFKTGQFTARLTCPNELITPIRKVFQ